MKLAEELDLMLHIHLSESAGEVEQCRSLARGQASRWAMPVIWGC